jgi:hypothetical protein
MQRIRAMIGLAALLGLGTATALGGQYMSQYWHKSSTPPDGIHWGPSYPIEVPTVRGAWGEPVEMAAPYNSKPPSGAEAARAMIASSQPLDMVQQSGYFKDSAFPIMPTGGQCPGGVCPAPGVGGPPATMISPPGIAAAPAAPLPPGLRPPGAVAAVGALTGAPAAPFPVQRTEVRFVGPAGMKISWYGPSADGRAAFGPQYLQAPARYNFLQASIYRLKLSDIPNRPGLELYPTLEVVPAKPKTCTFLAHSAVPITFTEEDFEQVAAGNFVVKVIYLPDPQFQDLAVTGPDEVVSSRLEPGIDPIIEAKRRGCILLVVRLGNIDLEAPNTPAMDAPNPFAPVAPACPPGVTPPPLPPPPGAPVPPGLPAVPGVPFAGQQPMPNMPNPMAPNMPGRQPMMPYGMLNGQPLQPGTMEMQRNPGMVPPGQMLPPPGVPGMYPTGTQFPSQMLPPAAAPGTYPTGTQLPGQMLPPIQGMPGTNPSSMQLPGQTGMPTSRLSSPSGVQSAKYQSGTSASQRLPTLAELAGQPENAKAPSVTR